MVEQFEGINLMQQSLLKPDPLGTRLTAITAGIVKYFNADFCRIWILQSGDLCERGCVHAKAADEPGACRQRDKCLRLVASSGRPDLDNDGDQRCLLMVA